MTDMSDVVIMEGEDALFETIVSGKPEPTIEWFNGMTQLIPSNRIFIGKDDSKHKLEIKYCLIRESGVLSAKASNRGGTAITEATLVVKGV